jgi:chromate reductase
MSSVRILGISGSLRRESHNTALLRHVGALFEAEGADFEIYDGLRDIPPYSEDDDVEDAPAAVARLRAAVAEADAVFLSTPEYSSSIPGALKNALDWVSRPFATNAMRNKPAAVAGASAGIIGTARAQAEVRKVLSAMGARVLNDPNPEQQLRELVAALMAEARSADPEQRGTSPRHQTSTEPPSTVTIVPLL